MAEWAVEVHQLSQRRAARLIPVDRATLRYEHHRDRRTRCGCACENLPAVVCATGIVVNPQACCLRHSVELQ